MSAQRVSARPHAPARLETPPAPAQKPAADPDADLATHPGAVTSPMVGTAYRAPEPGTQTRFVEVGAAVERGQTAV